MLSIYAMVVTMSREAQQTAAEKELAAAPQTDGRRARRERGRRAAIDAAFELMQQGKVRPSVEAVAARAGVSTASIFRYFDGLDDLERHAHERFFARFVPLLDVGDHDGPRPRRIERFVDARLDFYEQAGALLAAGRARAHDDPTFVDARNRMRTARVDQAKAMFAAELDGAGPARTSDLVATVDATTAPETWDLLREFHGWSRRRIRTTWVRNLTALIDAWEAT